MTAPSMAEGWEPIETLEHAALIVAAFVAQGRIGPLRLGDREAESLLAALTLIAQKVEPQPATPLWSE